MFEFNFNSVLLFANLNLNSNENVKAILMLFTNNNYCSSCITIDL